MSKRRLRSKAEGRKAGSAQLEGRNPERKELEDRGEKKEKASQRLKPRLRKRKEGAQGGRCDKLFQFI